MKASQHTSLKPLPLPGMIDDAQSTKQSRRLLLLERTMYRDGSTPFTSVFTIMLRGVLGQPQLCRALAQVQEKHPLLRCVIEDAADGPRFVLCNRPAPIPLRIQERRTRDDWPAEVRREWIRPFNAGQPLVRLVWLRGSDLRELMLVAHHCICDGPSGITLLRELLRTYDNPEENLGTYDDLGGIQDLITPALLCNPRFRIRVGWRMGLVRIALRLKARRRPRTGIRIDPEQMYFHRWQLDEPATLALTLRCRSEGVTVLTAVSIAVLQAFQSVRGPSALTKAYAMVNARKFMPRLRPDALFGIAPAVALSLKGLRAPLGASIGGFWNRARSIRDDLARRIDRLGAGFYEYLAGLETLHDQYPRLVADTEAAPAVRHITLSNIGRIDLPQQYKAFRIEEVYSPLVMVSPSPANTLVLSSFAGRMEFAIVSDEVSLPQEQGLAILERTVEILRACVEAAPQSEISARTVKEVCA